ncbi:MAG: cytochrome c oxidase subunit 2A [Bacteroidetes bacterium]|nr:hypothetical protein AWN76_001590 [Rhodothermaceae bacterium RA]RMH54634.1 MAG: cytochrome c oxidase subunit 2A [Bacteroidota bacterium]
MPEPTPYADLAPATGTDQPVGTDLPPEEEPVVTGTLFLTLIFLMMVFGFWITIYVTLLNR